jgi:hypothetical protein
VDEGENGTAPNASPASQSDPKPAEPEATPKPIDSPAVDEAKKFWRLAEEITNSPIRLPSNAERSGLTP